MSRRDARWRRLGGRFADASTANGLQVLGQNDNGWDQGAIFLHPGAAWLSPLGVAIKALGAVSLPAVCTAHLEPADPTLDVVVLCDGRGRFAARVVHPANGTRSLAVPAQCWRSTRLAGDPAAVNPPSDPDRINLRNEQGRGAIHIAPFSFTIVEFPVDCAAAVFVV